MRVEGGRVAKGRISIATSLQNLRNISCINWLWDSTNPSHSNSSTCCYHGRHRSPVYRRTTRLVNWLSMLSMIWPMVKHLNNWHYYDSDLLTKKHQIIRSREITPACESIDHVHCVVVARHARRSRDSRTRPRMRVGNLSIQKMRCNSGDPENTCCKQNGKMICPSTHNPTYGIYRSHRMISGFHSACKEVKQYLVYNNYSRAGFA